MCLFSGAALGGQSESSGTVSSSKQAFPCVLLVSSSVLILGHTPAEQEDHCCPWGSAWGRTLTASSLLLLFQTQFSGKPVHERGLVVTDLRAEDVVLEHRSYCSAKAHKRHFAGDILGYVTPVSRALGWAGRSQGQGGCSGLSAFSPPLAAAAMGVRREPCLPEKRPGSRQASCSPWRGQPCSAPVPGWLSGPLPRLQAGSPILRSLPVEQTRLRCRQDLRGQVYPHRARVAAAEEARPRDV